MGGKIPISQSAIAIVAIGLLVALSTEAAFARANSPGATLTVLVFNYSQLSPAGLVRAEHETSRIFDQSGIRMAWTDCQVLATPDVTPACQGEPVLGQLRVRILPKHLNHEFSDSIFGFAIAPFWASVYYESALRLTQTSTSSETDIPAILSCLIAHEIGHLLLGANHHTANGIMQARWDIRQIQLAMTGTLLFTPEESNLMLRKAQLRRTPTGEMASLQLSR